MGWLLAFAWLMATCLASCDALDVRLTSRFILPDITGAAAETVAVEHPSIGELIANEGYPVEVHYVNTPDGYILGMYRIPYGRDDHLSAAASDQRPAVLLQHALLDCVAAWLVNGGNGSFAFMLADAGYDVWMGNIRGNTYSRSHMTLDPDSDKFWDFSFDEHSQIDLPAMVDYVLATSSQKQLAYIGHSQGATMALAGLATLPQLHDKMALTVLLAPSAFASHVTAPLLVDLSALGALSTFKLLGIREFLPANRAASELYGEACKVLPMLCVDAISAICGYNVANINATRLPLYLNFTPAGTSVKNMVHWSQSIGQSGPARFYWYDYGTQCRSIWGTQQRCNQREYGRRTPPLYDLSRVNVSLALFTGGRDLLSDPLDDEALIEALPPGSLVLQHVEDSYEHLDFTWGIDAHERVYPLIISLLDKQLRLEGQR